MSNISIEELETLFKLVIGKLKKDKLDKIQITTDFYWIVTSDEWDDFESSPNPAVGSLVEDVEYLKRAIDEGEIFTYNDFDRLSAVLRVISEKQAPINQL